MKTSFLINASWACLCQQTGLPRGSLLLKDDAFVELLQFETKKLFATPKFIEATNSFLN